MNRLLLVFLTLAAVLALAPEALAVPANRPHHYKARALKNRRAEDAYDHGLAARYVGKVKRQTCRARPTSYALAVHNRSCCLTLASHRSQILVHRKCHTACRKQQCRALAFCLGWHRHWVQRAAVESSADLDVRGASGSQPCAYL